MISLSQIPFFRPVTLRPCIHRKTILRAAAVLALAATFGSGLARATAPSGYLQTNLISNGAVQARTMDKNFVDPWGISIGQAFWINTNVTGLDYIADASGDIFFTVSIPPASGHGIGSPTGTVYIGSLTGSGFLLPDMSQPSFLFCSLDGSVSGWAGGSTQITVNNRTAKAVYTDMALLTTDKASYVLLANFGAGAAVEVYDANWKRALPGAFKDPSVPATYAPYAVHVLGGKVYVTYAPRNSSDYSEILGAGHGFVDAFDLTGKFLGRVIPTGGKLNAPWGMALAPAGFGKFAGDMLVGNFGDGAIDAYDPKTWQFKGQISDPDGNPILNPGLWEIVFGQENPAVGDPNKLYFTAGLNQETAGLFGVIAVAPAGAAKTTTGLTSDGNPRTLGLKVTFTALVQPASGNGEPHGKVSFTVDGKQGAIVMLDSTGHASASTSSLTVGSHKIVATYAGDANFGSSFASLTQVITKPAAAMPGFSPPVGTYNKAQTIALSDSTPKATIYYTTDGSTPTRKSTVYTKPFQISKTTTIKAFATAAGFLDSPVATGKYTINLGATAVPVFTPAGGTFDHSFNVTIKSATVGASIHYTLNGSVPTTASTTYAGPIAVSKTTTIKAIAAASGLAESQAVTATFTITPATADKPTFKPAPGYYYPAASVTLADATAGAVLHYTVDSSTPTESSPVYSKPILVDTTTTIKAIAIVPGGTASGVAIGTYFIRPGY